MARFAACLSVFTPQSLCVRLLQRHFTHGRQQLNIVFYVSACQGRWIFIGCSEPKADKQLYHMISLINGHYWLWLPWQSYFCVHVKLCVCVCVCALNMPLRPWAAGLRRKRIEGFGVILYSRWIVDAHKRVSAGNCRDANERTLNFQFLGGVTHKDPI